MLKAAIGQRLIAQAVAFFQQQKPLVFDHLFGGFDAARQFLGFWQRQQKAVFKQGVTFDVCFAQWQRQQQHIELAVEQFLGQRRGLSFTHMKFEIGIFLLEQWQQRRQQIRRNRRDNAEPQRTGQHTSGVLGIIDEIAHVGQQFARAHCYFFAFRGQLDAGARALNQR